MASIISDKVNTKLGHVSKGKWLDVLDPSSKKWHKAEVMDCTFTKILVEYTNLDSRHTQEWIQCESNLYRLEPLNTHTRTLSTFKHNSTSKSSNPTQTSETSKNSKKSENDDNSLFSQFLKIDDKSKHKSKSSEEDKVMKNVEKIIIGLQNDKYDLTQRLMESQREISKLKEENRALKLKLFNAHTQSARGAARTGIQSGRGSGSGSDCGKDAGFTHVETLENSHSSGVEDVVDVIEAVQDSNEADLEAWEEIE